MTIGDERWSRYVDLRHAVPERFKNDPQPGAITIVDRPTREQMAAAGVMYEDQYLMLVRDIVTFPNGDDGTYIRLMRKPLTAAGVAILPIYLRSILLVEHFRHAVRDVRLEIPRGFAEPGLSDEENASRELFEEIEGDASELISLGSFEPDTGLSGDATKLFAARIEHYGQPELAEGILNIVKLDLTEFKTRIANGQITDSHTIIAFTRASLLGILD